MEQFLSDFHFDFAVFLTVLTVVSAIGWVLDKWWLAPARAAAGEPEKGNPFIEFCRFSFPVVIVVLVLRSFVFEPFRIPSGSMIPTLRVGDFILVNKYSYGLRTPVGFWEFLELGRPERGDVAVFRFPLAPEKDFIKRVIGVPGDTVVYRDKQLIINGEAVELENEGMFALGKGPSSVVVQRFRELLDDAEHSIIVNPSRRNAPFQTSIPDGHYFVMGDNRDGSDDSRRWGLVPERNLVGKAVLVWMSWNADSDWINFDRIGTMIR